jgi:hypothetical protein
LTSSHKSADFDSQSTPSQKLANFIFGIIVLLSKKSEYLLPPREALDTEQKICFGRIVLQDASDRTNIRPLQFGPDVSGTVTPNKLSLSDGDVLSDQQRHTAAFGTLGLTETLALDLAISEDIVVNTAPDIVFHLALRQTF